MLKSATVHDEHLVRLAVMQLREARDNLKAAGAGSAADKVRLALTSAEGAMRHVSRRVRHGVEVQS